MEIYGGLRKIITVFVFVIIPTAMFKHIAILVPAVAKSFHSNTHFGTKRKTLETKQNVKSQQVTMYIKNRRNSNEFKGFGSYQTLCLTESFVLRNRLLFIY